ncbi:hypothetical protein DRW03_17915 [Corallococcus sp. H22C18031201]|uniref:hypothetical protein n=1 Tax=Citreicoccus inhibens TaxID=2849499 RepID=UPI000E71227D|nr:hypothetical protein [Citreicoccus inhibens]MBU8898434.1 hypothetical protein [Citreicoccus inhibens]RJS21283.1 hypothetical protein DRW03_17915 [Corallococcus sp. H22C18031201]
MTEPTAPPPSSAAPLQFEHAEFSDPVAAPQCAVCKKAIAETYFEVTGNLLCPSCRAELLASLEGGSAASRAFRATGLGVGAAIAGAVLYYVVNLTGYNLGIIAVAVGWMVGMAVRRGSDGRGGWFYQTLAVLLTYLSICASLAPDVYAGVVSEGAQGVLGVLVTIVVSLGAPVIVGMEGPLSLLIYGFALFEAWRRNKRLEVKVDGPFRLSARAPASASPPAEASSVG